MNITDLPAYKRIKKKFESGEFHEGTKSTLPIYYCKKYYYKDKMRGKLTPGHYVSAIEYCQVKFRDVPKEFRTRDFFLNALSSVHKDVLAYVKAHLDKEFDRDFFKDHIATDMYALSFEENCFEYMPLNYIDEEMIACGMLAAVKNRYCERRGDFEDWFYSVARRKPEVLTQDFWTLGARLFAARKNKTNKFLNITPEQYRTEEYYFAMCLENNTTVMEDFPKEILTPNFLLSLINDCIENIKSFTEEALEKKVLLPKKNDEVKLWQAALMSDGFIFRYIPLNDERVEFFFEHYDKESAEFRYGFKDAYIKYLNTKEEGFNE